MRNVIGFGAVAAIGASVAGAMWLSSSWKRVARYLSPGFGNTVVLPQETGSDDPIRFPQVSGFNLLDEQYQLPDDFDAPLNVVVLAYTQRQQYDVNTWVPLLAELETRYSNIHYYEFPTVTNFNPLFQAQLDSLMVAGIPDPDTRGRTVTLYLDVATFNAALNIPDTRDIQLLVVSQQGDVLWQGSGPYNNASANALQAALITAGAQ